MTRRLPLFLLLLILSFSFPQTGWSQKSDKFELQGYIKYLQSSYIFNKSNSFRTFTGDRFLVDNLIHNRLNFRIYPTKSFTIAVDVRNRIYYGEYVKAINDIADSLSSLPPIFQSLFPPQILQDFGQQLDNNDDIYDMSVLIFNKHAAAWHAMLDRAYIDWHKGKFDLTIGRQRINWGVTLVWNPNDIFNTYSFYDFDYEERPGSDAVRFTYYRKIASSLEIAGKVATKKDDVVAAALYKWNAASYDFQILGGVAHKDVTLGAGWAGNLKNAGFKGEFTYFQPYGQLFDTTGVFNGSLSFDYSFKNGLYFNVSYLFASAGDYTADFSILTSLNPSAKELSPYKHTFFTQFYYPFTPILNGGGALIYSPGKDQALFLNPVLTYSVKENWDIDLVGQIFLSKLSDSYQPQTSVVYVRLKWSF